jgi:death-on-curing protein
MPRFITIAEAIAIHDDQITRFGGSPGIRDIGLLESAITQPEATFFGELLHPTIASQAAAYLFHISRNHAFLDGNKRTALAVADTFLFVNGYKLVLSDDDLYNLVQNVAQGLTGKDTATELIAGNLMGG